MGRYVEDDETNATEERIYDSPRRGRDARIPQAEGRVTLNCGKLVDAVDRLDEIVANLQALLEPILLPEESEKKILADSESDIRMSSDLAQKIENQATSIDRIGTRLNQTLCRVDL
jgi:hypothetical protein